MWECVQSSPLICGFAFHGSSYLRSAAVQKHYMENSGNKHFISFKLHIILNRVMKSLDVLLHPARDMDQPFVPCVHPRCVRSLPVSHSVAVSIIRSAVTVSQCLCVSPPYFTS